LAFHNSDEYDSRINLASPRVQYQPAAVQRTYSEPARKSSRVSSKPVTYDDDVEILEIDVSPKKSKDMDAKKFGKLTLSAKRKIVEENNTEDEPDYTNRQSKLKKNITGVTHEITKMTNNNKKISANISGKDEEILLIELEDVDEKVDGKRLELNCSLSKPVQKKIKTAREDETKDLKNDEEILLTDDDVEDVVEKNNGKRLKQSSKLSKPAGKRLKTIKNDEPNDLVEVKSSSGKSMMVSKATLEKIMKSKTVQAAVASKATADNNNTEDVKGEDNTKQSIKINSSPVERRKTRSMGR